MTARRLAYFVSSHGFGHAARAAAVLDRLLDRAPDLEVHVFAGTPSWFFEQSFAGPLPERLIFHPWDTDVGLVQATALEEDLRATVERLGAWYPLSTERLDPAVDAIRELQVDALVTDISPLGLAVAQELGLPSILIENFTWSWIYRGYRGSAGAELEPFAECLAPLFQGATRGIRTAPFCGPLEDSTRQTSVGPVARRPRSAPEDVRRALDIPPDEPMVLVTMGGVPWDFKDLESHLKRRGLQDCHLVVAGGADTYTRLGRARLIPHQSEFFHPDLALAADAVVAKLGYSTVAEVATCGGRLGYVPRPRFPESPELERWVLEHLSCRRFEPEDLEDGSWLDGLGELLDRPAHPPVPGGVDRAAEIILGF